MGIETEGQILFFQRKNKSIPIYELEGTLMKHLTTLLFIQLVMQHNYIYNKVLATLV